MATPAKKRKEAAEAASGDKLLATDKKRRKQDDVDKVKEDTKVAEVKYDDGEMELTLKQFHKEQGRIYTIQDKLDDINNAGEHDLGTELLMAPKLPREGEDVGGWENAIETMIDFIMDLARCPAAIQKGKEKVSDQTRDTLIAYKKLFEQQQQDVMSGKRDDGTEAKKAVEVAREEVLKLLPDDAAFAALKNAWTALGKYDAALSELKGEDTEFPNIKHDIERLQSSILGRKAADIGGDDDVE